MGWNLSVCIIKQHDVLCKAGILAMKKRAKLEEQPFCETSVYLLVKKGNHLKLPTSLTFMYLFFLFHGNNY